MKVRVSNLIRSGRGIEVEAVVDTGAIYPMFPARLLQSIGVRPSEKKRFHIANGGSMMRGVGEARLSINGQNAPCKVIFGQKKDPILLGALALESMGLGVDPVRKQLKPITLVLY